MQTDAFDFELPKNLIALRPAEPRGAARLLVVYSDGRLEHGRFSELPERLRSGDVLCFNDTRVIAARIRAYRPPRLPESPPVALEITLHKRTDVDRFRAFVQPAKRLRLDDVLSLAEGFEARVTARDGGEVELIFDRGGAALDQAIAALGAMPLPPYIAKKRAPDARDRQDYQTIYAAHDGSVAAPTAGLHFTHAMLARLAQTGVETAPITLHVGAGTFLPVTAEDTTGHRMQAEQARVSAQAAANLNAAHARGGRIVAVGTTSLRTLESATDEAGQVHPFGGDTEIFITPGYRFRAVDVLITNFHLPRSTLFMLVSAFMGLEVMQRAYAEAIRQEYRFYSYGDACLLLRAP